MIRLGAIGAGMIFSAYQQAADMLGVTIRAVADPDPERLSAAARPDRLLLTTLDDLLRTPLDAVLILTPNHTHAPLARECVGRGLDTLCEKPLAISLAEARGLVEWSATQKAVLHPAMHCRYRPEILYLQRHLSGRVVSFTQVWREQWMQAPAWYFDPSRSGGGVLLDVGLNQIDWIHPFLDSPRVAAVELEMGESGVELECRMRWTCATGEGTTVLSWRAEEEEKRSRLVTDRGEVFDLDHAHCSLLHNGEPKGPWRSTEYAEVLTEFLRCRSRRPDPPDRRPIEVLSLLRDAYAQAGLSFLR